MQRILAGIYLILSIGHLIYELVGKSFQNGLESDSEVYQREASEWINGMLVLIMGTGVLTLAMDYSNTKSVLNLFIIGFVSGSLGATLDARRAKWRKQEENL